MSLENVLKRLTWQERTTALVSYYEQHESTCRELADEFNMSKTHIGRDLNLGYALRVYPQLEKVEGYNEAVEFIKKVGFKRKLDDD